MTHARLAVPAVLLVLACAAFRSSARACCFEERPPYPSFDVDACTWQADHVVFVTSQSGTLRVVDSWKGRIAPGTSLSTALVRSVTLAVHSAPRNFEARTLVLFLKDAEPELRPANAWHVELQGSVAFIESGGVYGLKDDPDQWRFVPTLVGSAPGFRARVAHVGSLQETFERVLDEASVPAARAAALEHFVRCDVAPAVAEALVELARCDRVAVASLVRLARGHDALALDAIRALARVGSEHAEHAIADLLAREVVAVYALPGDESVEPHAQRLDALLYAVSRSPSREARELVLVLDAHLETREDLVALRRMTSQALFVIED